MAKAYPGDFWSDTDLARIDEALAERRAAPDARGAWFARAVQAAGQLERSLERELAGDTEHPADWLRRRGDLEANPPRPPDPEPSGERAPTNAKGSPGKRAGTGAMSDRRAPRALQRTAPALLRERPSERRRRFDEAGSLEDWSEPLRIASVLDAIREALGAPAAAGGG